MDQSYRQFYHANVPSGWANDPNGTIFYRGKAHLFYQHYPHKAEWGTMHWGHFVTEDFVRWESLPVALVPDRDYEALCGCCSGSTIEKDGKLYLMYTAAQPDLQRQCMAVSEDGVHFEKNAHNPIITADAISPEISPMDFRDPRMFRRGGVYYLIAGARIVNPGAAAGPGGVSRPVESPSRGGVSCDLEKDGYGNLVLLRSGDLLHWSYVGKLFYPQSAFSPEFFRLNGVYECPDYFTLNGYEVLLSSPQNLPQMGRSFQNLHSALYMLGTLDFTDGHFSIDVIEELDSGFDFYAAQTLRMPDGRVIMLAWKEMWDRNYPTQKEGWAGTYTLPRELTVENGRLVQRPVREIERYRENPLSRESLTVNRQSAAVEGIRGSVTELLLTLEPGDARQAGVKVFCGGEHETLVYYDRDEGVLVFDRSRSGIPLTGKEPEVNRRVCAVENPERIPLRLFLDVCSLEVFVDGGLRVMTGNVYPEPEDLGVEFFARDGEARFLGIEKYDIRRPAST